MKKSIVVASLVLASSCLVAQDSMKDWFVGAEVGGMNVKVKAFATDGVDSASASDNSKTTYEAVKFGKYIDNSRIYAAIHKQNEKDDVSSYGFSVGYDYLFKNSSVVIPFVGVNVGYTKAKIDDDVLALAGIDKPSGFHYGIGAGVIYPFNNNVEFEAGLRYNKTNVKDDLTVAPAKVEIEAESYVQYYIGVNYKF